MTESPSHDQLWFNHTKHETSDSELDANLNACISGRPIFISATPVARRLPLESKSSPFQTDTSHGSPPRDPLSTSSSPVTPTKPLTPRCSPAHLFTDIFKPAGGWRRENLRRRLGDAPNGHRLRCTSSDSTGHFLPTSPPSLYPRGLLRRCPPRRQSRHRRGQAVPASQPPPRLRRRRLRRRAGLWRGPA